MLISTDSLTFAVGWRMKSETAVKPKNETERDRRAFSASLESRQNITLAKRYLLMFEKFGAAPSCRVCLTAHNHCSSCFFHRKLESKNIALDCLFSKSREKRKIAGFRDETVECHASEDKLEDPVIIDPRDFRVKRSIRTRKSPRINFFTGESPVAS